MPAPTTDARPGTRRPGRTGSWATLVPPVAALVLLGVLTGLLGTAVHLARTSVLGLPVPWGVLLAVALVVACDVAVGAASTGRRPGAGAALLAVAAGRALAVGVLLLPRPEGDVVLTGLPASTAWILLGVLLPAFASPMATALGLARRPAPRGQAAR